MIKALGFIRSPFTGRRLLAICPRRPLIHTSSRSRKVPERFIWRYEAEASPDGALKTFDEIPQRAALSLSHASSLQDGESANSVIVRLAKEGCTEEVLELFRSMRELGIVPTKYALSTVLSSCSKLSQLSLGLQIHGQVTRMGHEDNLFISNSILDLYAKCGLMNDARRVFSEMPEHDQVSWTSIISGCAQNALGEEAFQLFVDMIQSNIKPNCFTFASLVSACTGLASIDLGKQVHAQVIIVGVDEDTFVMNSLLDMYAKCGDVEDARYLFESKLEKDIVIYNSLIAGYAQNLYGEEALHLFVQLQFDDLKPNGSTFAGVLNACGHLAVLQQGKQIHSLIIKVGTEFSVFVASSLIDMYSKCGSIEEARCVFDQVQEKNCVLWTTMITSYAQSGKGRDAIELFEQLVEAGMTPDRICFTSVLTACNHGGFVDKAIQYFKSMQTHYGLMPEMDHYACMVDLYGRNGLLIEAKKLIDHMPMKPNYVIWTSFLGACKINGVTQLGMKAAEHIHEIEPGSASPYVATANAYAEEGMWDKAAEVRKVMKDRGVRKRVGCSWIEVDKKAHVFITSDRSHPQSQEIYLTLDNVILEMRDVGSVPSLIDEQQDDISTQGNQKLSFAF
ncbi:pentatricopeptide repeat-containing protein At2g13600-like [Nymphaea colorata]|uniref:DYW domain-containing protein n=1 Tax=Nymphaea colorata TaxID=210225 RepID=A0A5K1D7G4_9MAGN|nr:pentatricopeptide repeat-containing protein At2g13600-like [Nymphaea colorata]